MVDDLNPQSSSGEGLSESNSSQIGGNESPGSISWNDFVKTYGSKQEEYELERESSKREVELKDDLSEKKARVLLEEDIRTEKPLTPLSFIYELSLYEKEDISSPEMIGSIREARSEIATILNSYTPDLYRVLVESMTVWGGWQNLVKHGYEKTGKNGFGKGIQNYINLRIPLLEAQQSDSRLAPIQKAERSSLQESLRKTTEVIQRQINSNNK